MATDSTGATGTDTLKLVVVDTGIAAPRSQGAVPDAERRLRAGSAVPARFGWVQLAPIGAAAVAPNLPRTALNAVPKTASTGPPARQRAAPICRGPRSTPYRNRTHGGRPQGTATAIICRDDEHRDAARFSSVKVLDRYGRGRPLLNP